MATTTMQSPRTPSPCKRYTLIDRTFTSRYEFIADNDLGDEDETPLYTAKYSYFARNKPDLLLYTGQGEEPHLAVACARTFTHTMACKLGVGDMSSGGTSGDYTTNLQWEDFKPANLVRKSKWNWTFTRPQQGSANLVWKGTSHHAVDGKKVNSWSSSNWKLVAEGDEQTILAVFTGRPGLTTVCGSLQINADWGERFDYLVLITSVLL